MKYTCILVSNDPTSTSSLETYIKNDHDITSFKIFTSVTEAIASLSTQNKVDCIFVNISTRQLETFSTSLKLVPLTRSLILISSHPGHINEGKHDELPNFHPLPVNSKKSFNSLLDKMQAEIRTNTNAYFMVRKEKGSKLLTRCYYDSITYIEAKSNYVEINTSKTKFVYRRTLSEMQKLLEDKKEFIRIHNSFIISTHAVEEARGTFEVKVIGKQLPIPVGEHYRPGFKNFLNEARSGLNI